MPAFIVTEQLAARGVAAPLDNRWQPCPSPAWHRPLLGELDPASAVFLAACADRFIYLSSALEATGAIAGSVFVDAWNGRGDNA